MLRVITASLLIGLLIAALWSGPVAFAVFIAGMVLLCWREFAALSAEAGAAPLRGLGRLLALACSLSFVLQRPGAPAAALGATILIASLTGLAAGRRHPALAVRRVLATVGGICWVGLLPGYQLALLQEPRGVTLLAMLYAAVSSGDIVAYYGGTLLGRRPLAPALSPGKTIEGTICGLIASGAAGAIVAHYWVAGVSPLTGVAVGTGLGFVGQAGDLLESSLKRAARAKDSSALLPGHGGVLDRVDGLLLAAPLLYLIVYVGAL